MPFWPMYLPMPIIIAVCVILISGHSTFLTSTMELTQSQRALLKKITEEQKCEEYEVKKKDGNGSSIMSSIFEVTLRAKGKQLKLFAKSAAWSEDLRLEMPITCPYTVELYFYRTLWGKYAKLEETFNVPNEYRFSKPMLYGSSAEYLHETLVIEDLIDRGYVESDRNVGADFEYMSTGISLMAEFHALSLAYFKYDPEGFEQTSQYLTMDESKIKPWMASVAPKMLSNALSTAENHKDKLQKFLENRHEFHELFMTFYRRRNNNILIHGDFKPGNLMRRRKNGKLEMVVVDFQLVRDGDPIVDLTYFIITSTDEAFRRAHYQELLDLYYEKLTAALVRLRVDPEEVYSEKTYRARIAECRMLGLVMAMTVLPVVLADQDNAPTFNKEGDDLSDFAVESNALFHERFNGILNNYVEWGLL